MGERLSGGCQCGAVRFEASEFGRASICHCRMCQKAFGGFFGALVTARDARWTRGTPSWFASSNAARRGFCKMCGTPLAYETAFGLELAIGAFDRPDHVAPVIQVNLSDRLALFARLGALSEQREPGPAQAEFLGGVHSRQHPDHDTAVWPAQGETV
jgi:hypothetical protein